MASFYFPIQIEIENIPLIIYPCIGVEKVLSRDDNRSLKSHISTLYKTNPSIKTGQYHILILWENEGDLMSDVWIFDKIESWGSGPLIDIKVFKRYTQETSIGLSAGDGVIMIGRETELEENLRKSGKDLREYISGKRAELPDDIAPQENLYS